MNNVLNTVYAESYPILEAHTQSTIFPPSFGFYRWNIKMGVVDDKSDMAIIPNSKISGEHQRRVVKYERIGHTVVIRLENNDAVYLNSFLKRVVIRRTLVQSNSLNTT